MASRAAARSAVGEVISAGKQGHGLAVAGHADIGQAAIHAGGRQQIGAIHGHALGLVDRDGVAVIDGRILLGAELAHFATIQAHGQAAIFGPLDGAAEIELVGREHKAVRRDHDPLDPVALPHVEHDLFVGHQLVVQREVVAVGIQVRLDERVDDDVLAQAFANLMAGENHDRVRVFLGSGGRDA